MASRSSSAITPRNPCARGGGFDAERRLDRAGEGDRIGDGGIAADPARESRRALEARPAHQRVDAFVGVAEPLFEPDDRLAACVEAEMAGLDDPGMDRTDRDLMQARPRGLEEGVGVGRAVTGRAVAERMAQRPAAVVEPAAAVRRAEREEAVEVASRPFEPAGRRMQRRDRGKRAAIASNFGEGERPGVLAQGEPHPPLVAPQADQGRLPRRHAPAGLEPVGFAGKGARRGHSGLRFAFGQVANGRLASPPSLWGRDRMAGRADLTKCLTFSAKAYFSASQLEGSGATPLLDPPPHGGRRARPFACVW